MARLHETLETALPIERAFAFVADFSNADRWDPGVAWSKAVSGATPAVGVEYELGVRMGGRVAPMSYRITLLKPAERVVLGGRGSNVAAVDDIRFERTGWLRLAAPFARGSFAAIARNARDGMQRTLDALAAQESAA